MSTTKLNKTLNNRKEPREFLPIDELSGTLPGLFMEQRVQNRKENKDE